MGQICPLEGYNGIELLPGRTRTPACRRSSFWPVLSIGILDAVPIMRRDGRSAHSLEGSQTSTLPTSSINARPRQKKPARALPHCSRRVRRMGVGLLPI
jgi:hypothetical protein